MSGFSEITKEEDPECIKNVPKPKFFRSIISVRKEGNVKRNVCATFGSLEDPPQRVLNGFYVLFFPKDLSRVDDRLALE